MTQVDDRLSNNALTILALCNEYCSAIENVSATMPSDFVTEMLRLLPRIYISVTVLSDDVSLEEGTYIASSLDEETYDRVRAAMASLLGEDDAFLEVFMDDMKYSDTPITATISELLADLFQVFYDFLETCRDAHNELINEALGALKSTFEEYWSQTLVNVLRALNWVKYIQ